jgi:hypothetical protein
MGEEQQCNAKKETDESFFLKDAIIQPSTVIDDDLFRKLLGGDASAETLDEFVPLAVKKDALDSEVVTKTDSVVTVPLHRACFTLSSCYLATAFVHSFRPLRKIRPFILRP